VDHNPNVGDRQLDALLERLDRIAAQLERPHAVRPATPRGQEDDERDAADRGHATSSRMSLAFAVRFNSARCDR